MKSIFPDRSRPETVVAALLYMMTAYRRSQCPRLALCIARHLQCLAAHADAATVLQHLAATLHGEWEAAAVAGQPVSCEPRGPFRLH